MSFKAFKVLNVCSSLRSLIFAILPQKEARSHDGSASSNIKCEGCALTGYDWVQGILVEIPFAGFFLKKFRTGQCDVNDLPTLDAELATNLMFLRDYDGDFAELALTFTISDSEYGVNREVNNLHVSICII